MRPLSRLYISGRASTLALGGVVGQARQVSWRKLQYVHMAGVSQLPACSLALQQSFQ